MHLAQRELSEKGKFAIFLLCEISKVRLEMTRCFVALGKEWEMIYNYFGYNLLEKRD